MWEMKYLQGVREERDVVHTIKRRKANWIGHKVWGNSGQSDSPDGEELWFATVLRQVFFITGTFSAYESLKHLPNLIQSLWRWRHFDLSKRRKKSNATARCIKAKATIKTGSGDDHHDKWVPVTTSWYHDKWVPVTTSWHHDKWVPVTTSWRVHTLRMEERPADVEGSCDIYSVSSRGQQTRGGPPVWGLGEALTAPHLKNLTKASEQGRLLWKR